MSIERQNQSLDYLIDSSYQEENRFFVLSCKNNAQKTRLTGHFLPKVEIKDYNVMTDRKFFLDQPVKMIKEHMITFEKLQKVKEMITPPIVN